MTRLTPRLVALLQCIIACRVVLRMARTARGERIERAKTHLGPEPRVSVLVPVLDEEARLGPCLEGLIGQDALVAEIVVIDGGSSDGTVAVAETFAARDSRVRVVSAAPVPANVNGKAWGLQAGLDHAAPESLWVLTVDADVRPQPGLVAAVVDHAERRGLPVTSVATRQRLATPAAGLLHPAMLATLVTRFGIPGHATRRAEAVQANGQCMLLHRSALAAVDGFRGVLDSVCEDVTLARSIAASGRPVGFFEADGLVAVEMYPSAAETWVNWTRSLPMRDRYTRGSSLAGLAEVTLVQALPLAVTLVAALRRGRADWPVRLNLGLVTVRLGMLAGMARAYESPPPTYWLSPLLDIPVAIRLWQMAFRTTHHWRGRSFSPGGPR